MEVPDLIECCGRLSNPPVLVEVETVFRQHTTIGRTRDARNLANLEAYVLHGTPILRPRSAPANADDLINQTQSAPPSTFTAGGSN